ncbi:MAG: prepilin-type N-terminal cleavage/methylation domain-containing protein [Planctomycetota bacterium]
MRRSLGFTLIELLVVVSISALLIAILLPALGRAREKTREMQCLTNQKSLVQGAMAYAANFKGGFPTSDRRDEMNDGRQFADAYDLRTAFPYSGARDHRVPLGLGLVISNGLLPAGVLGDVYHCPSLDTTNNPVIPRAGMDGTDPATGLGGSAWYLYPKHRITGSYNYRGTSFEFDKKRPMTMEDISPDFLMTMDTPDMRIRGEGREYLAHNEGDYYVTADGSGRFFRDTENMIDRFAQMSGTAGNVDGRRSGVNPVTGVTENNAEALYNYITDND